MIELQSLSMHYQQGGNRIDVLRDVDLSIGKGETVAITGPSGCGKTTLLLLLGALENPSSGDIEIDGVRLVGLSPDEAADLRRDRIGIVFQSFHLIPSLNALDNVALPLEISGHENSRAEATSLLSAVGLEGRAGHFPSQLSGGERQRVAIARALVARPGLILADEPTGNLDGHTGEAVSKLLFELVSEFGSTLVLVTHDQALAAQCGRALSLHDGQLNERKRAAA